MDLSNYDISKFEESQDFAPIPAGEYTAIIADSVEKDTKAGTGSYLELTLEIIDGEYKGRKIWDRLNLRNPNQAAVEIAGSTLRSICEAVGVPAPKESPELHNKPLLVSVATKARQDNGELTNEVKRYKPEGRRTVSTVSDNTPPWQR